MIHQPQGRPLPKARVLVLSLVFSLLLVGASVVAPGLLGGSRTANVAYAGEMPPPTGSVTVASPAKLTLAKTTVLVSGTFSCTSNQNAFSSGSLVVTLTQTQVGKQTVQGNNPIPLTVTVCDQGVVTYQVAVTPFGSTPFKGGPTVANATLTLNFNFGGTTFAVSTGNQTIRING